MSAVLGDVILPLVCIEDNICTVVLADTKGKPFTIVEFLFNYNTKKQKGEHQSSL